MDTHTLINPQEIHLLACECPDCHSKIMVGRPQPGEALLNVGCSLCAGIRPVETMKGRPRQTDFREVFDQLREWAEDGIFFVLSEEQTE